jgi:hypothetical protein
MQIISSGNSQALNSKPAPLELRSQDAQRVISSVTSPSAQQELQSSSSTINRDRVTLSAEAAALSRLARTSERSLQAEDGELVGLESTGSSISPSSSGVPSGGREQQELQEQQDLEISRELAERDREVRAHEQTHASIGGQYASAPSYTYERGPDGRMYAVEGEVKIDTSPIPNDPQATLEKAEVIQRAALSVAEPSSADRAAAADARAMAAEARTQILQSESDAQAAQAERADSAEDEDDNKPSAGERLQELRDEDAARSESAMEALDDFNDRLNDINKQLAEINKKLVDSGVFQKLFPEGSLLDRQA